VLIFLFEPLDIFIVMGSILDHYTESDRVPKTILELDEEVWLGNTVIASKTVARILDKHRIHDPSTLRYLYSEFKKRELEQAHKRDAFKSNGCSKFELFHDCMRQRYGMLCKNLDYVRSDGVGYVLHSCD